VTTARPGRRAHPVVAIDGPAGAGKSTVARKLAERLGFVLVDTGAMYRCVALAAKQAGVAWSEGPSVGALAAELVAVEALRFERDADRRLRVRLSGEDVSEAIRTPEIGMGASKVSAHAEVRAALLDLQRQSGRDGNVVLEGRDIGTVVFPDADIKFFLTARPEVRARRRYDELDDKGQAVTFEQTLAETVRRDKQDIEREHAPLRQASDAIVVDSSDATADEIVDLMATQVHALADA
jgi:CMP/dCMP kinase